ncbi:GumC family protein [Rhodobium gokarnense]|uniref:Uncharacterized protein involved in exopolysaccharide biosynthesis/Mrp family chromosome partitioning ATPase n=1 Tax=Rhodobium gokarnense TaxID=364296 RepID=A0ABT3HHS3_9HYPH|nr:exopolysaccharide transport family protein [Rhodobium gokarnense]MCW2309955.1 uncharacterized protein involved in exopolysaccharide biosynthesis/Mrp family chromosome partitioning ATPase [Rhodobium gokarnense]
MNSFPPNSQMALPVAHMPQVYAEPRQPMFGIGDVVTILWRHRRTVVITALIFATIAAVYAFGRERNYVAMSRILINPRGLQVVDREITPTSETNDGGIAMVESQMRVMTSNDVLAKVVAREHLGEDKEFVGGRGPVATIAGFLGSLAGGGRSIQPEIKALYNLQEAVRTQRPKRSYIVELNVKTKDGAKSARLANAIADVYINSEADAQSGLAGRASEMLTGRLDELRQQLSAAEEAVEQYKYEHNIVSSTGSLINEQELSQANQLLTQASNQTATALSKLEQVRRIKNTGDMSQPLPEAITSQTITRLRDRYGAAVQRREALSAQLLPSHPRMQAAKAEIDSARRQIVGELNRIAAATEADYERAKSHEDMVRARIETLKSGTHRTNDAMVRLRELQRDADAKRAVYEAFLVRARELSEQQRVDTTAARIVSRAIVPMRPDGPGSILIVLLGLFAGAGVGTMLAFGREALSTRISSPEQISQISNLPLLASIPIYPSHSSDEGLPEFVADDPLSPTALAIGDLLENLRPYGPGGDVKTVLVTSPGLNHGKTTVAFNLALAAARRGEKVLLVDGDATRRTLSALRVDDPEIGFFDVVGGKARLQDALVLDPGGLVMILPAGRTSGFDWSSSLTADKIKNAVMRRLPDVSLIVIDGPIGGRSDALAPFSESADASCLVIRSGEVDEATLKRSAANLRARPGKRNGSVFVVDAAE